MSDWQDEYDDALLKRGHIAGLREAAEIAYNLTPDETDGDHDDGRMEAGADITAAILARIAELEKTNGS